MAQVTRPPVHQIAWMQLIVLTLIVAPLLLFDREIAASVALGGLIQIIPNAWFTRQAYRYSGARQTRNVVNAMYRGESGKLLLTAALFAVVFYRLHWIDPVALFSSFGVMILVQLVSTVKVLAKAR